ncbi:arsenic resistance protein [Mammaliicoccus sp. Dog046]|uniref:arsenic resistance protein n=1 Tax=Mammaliicoccus sp. Dog046 TaxID=3034233 RepID=UPI002B25E69E|nr:arsenic resistance protein [Mammaliicoccus sp. Dog046]WQK84940.1 arsenic resistance protein [Mammaliicoccus sp. Dog046]
MNRIKLFLELKQIYIYMLFLIFGIVFGLSFEHAKYVFEPFISIFIIILMFGMFTQVPFFSLRNQRLNLKYLYALILSNFVFIPILVFTLVSLFNISSTPLLIGLYLVLLTPCIDYVIVFTNLGKGNMEYMLISTPILFILQMLLLPIYFLLFLNQDLSHYIDFRPFIETFICMIILPLLAAVALQFLSIKSKTFTPLLNLSEWIPVPFMALVLMTVVGSQMSCIVSDFHHVLRVVPIYICFMIIAPLIGLLAGKWFQLPVDLNRTLAFSSSTRNALVVLPLALSLPNQWSSIVTTVIVTQTLIELIGELIYIKLIPRLIK